MQDALYPCLWFDVLAHDAADFYCSVFPESEIVSKTPYVAIFRLNGRKFMALNGGPEFAFNEAVSFVVTCTDQEEIDYYWEKLTDGGSEGKCGWLKDKFGVSWQVVPAILGELMSDAEKAPKVMYAFMQMKRLVIADLIAALQD